MSSLRTSRAFTLLELLIVVGLIAALSASFILFLKPNRGAAMQSAQATVANMLVAARTRASASGQPARVLIQFDATSTDAASRFLRHLILQVQVSGSWQSITEAYLPNGVYVLPGNFSFPSGLLANLDSSWTKSDGSAMRSTALRSANISPEAIYGANVEQWVNIPFAAAGTTGAAGDLVLASGEVRAPGTYAAGESPVELRNPDEVRGLTISSYGVATLVNGRASF